MTPSCIKNDRVILYATYGGEEIYYVPVDGEASVFILNPPDHTVFPYSMISDYENLDGCSPEKLRKRRRRFLPKWLLEMGRWQMGILVGQLKII